MEGVNMHLLLLPHLFLTRTLRERKPNEDSGNVLGLTMPWADIPSWVPHSKCAFWSSVVPAQGAPGGGGVEWHFPA